MKKYLLLTFIVILFSAQFNAQSCLPGGITFSTQAQIDNFSANYPGCTEIEGQVIIEESSPGEILNLNGLSQLTSIDGNAYIRYNTVLGKLSGLDNVELVGGNLKIYSNPELDHLQNLSNLNFVEGDLLIKGNDDLNNLDGLHNLNSVDGDLIIENNDDLTKVDKLNSLQDLGPDNSLIIKNNSSLTKISNLGSLDLIEKDVEIVGNGLLTDLSGFGDITFIGGNLRIEDNNSLTNLDGMDDLEQISGSLLILDDNSIVNLTGLENLSVLKGNLYVKNNPALTSLTGLSSLTYLNGLTEIKNNDALVNMSGLDNITEIDLFYVTDNASLENFVGLGNLTIFHNEFFIVDNASLEDFTGLSNLEEIQWSFIVGNNDNLINFSGLNSLNNLSTVFIVNNNDALSNFTGLENLNSIGNEVTVSDNASLSNFQGLNSLTSIGEKLDIINNVNMSNLNGLEALQTIGGRLKIEGNSNILNITGIRNIDPNSIEANEVGADLIIKDNILLSECEVSSVCDFLDIPGKTTDISNNKVGCNSEAEIENACDGPDCTNLTDPVDGATDVDITTDLSWSSVVSAIGYKLTVGTTSGGTDILDHQDVGNVLTYDPGDFPCGSDIFVTITPYSYASDAIDCAEESFTTHGVNANAGTDKTICSSNSVMLQASGGTTYSWTPTTGLSDPNISNPIATPSVTTIYTVEVSDDSSCSDTDDVTVTVNPTPLPGASSTDETAYQANDGTATSNPSSGTPPFSFQWSNGQNTQTIVDLSPGNYTVTVTDDNGCTKEETVTVDEFICPDLTIESIQTNSSCFGQCDGEIEITGMTNGIAPFTYQWSTGDNTASIDNLCIGNYSVTVTDAKNCSESKSFTITQPTELFSNASATAETANDANDGTATANPTGGTVPYNYSWSNGGNTQTIDNLSPGNYTVTVTDDNGCTKEETITVDEFICPTLTIQSIQINLSCFGQCDGEIEITGMTNGVLPFTYQWSTGDNTALIDNLCIGNYSVTVTDSKNCSESKSFTITQPTELFANTSATDETANDANDGTATANPTGGTVPYNYSWSNGGNTQTIDNLSPGNYTVTVTDDNGCTKEETVTVNEFICPTLTIQSEQLNPTCNGNCNGSIEVIGLTNGVEPFTYLWSTGETNANILNLCAGTYSVTVTDADNCTATQGFEVTEPDVLLANATATNETENGAQDGTAIANPTGGTSPYEYAWSNGETSQNIVNLTPGNYTVTVTDDFNCTSIETVNVQEFICPTLTINASQTNVNCYNACNGAIEITSVTNAVQPLSYTWSNGETTPTINNLCPGTYTVTITDDKNCQVEKSYTITEPTELLVNASSTDETANNANDGTATANPSGGITPYSFAWSNGQNTQSISGLAPGSYTVTVTDNNGCTSIESVSIAEFGCQGLAIVISQINVKCNSECNGILDITGVTNGASPFTYTWSNGKTTAKIDSLCPGNYSVTVVDGNNCNVFGTYAITEPTELFANATATNETRNGANDGTASSNPSGGTQVYSYHWSNGQTTQSISGLTPGNYQLTVTDANGCTALDTVTIKEFNCPNLEVNSQTSNISCFDACDGTIVVLSVNNAASPFSYKWNTGAISASLNNLCAGDYSVTITDANNCEIIQNYALTQPDEITITIDSTRDIRLDLLGYIAISTNNNGNYIFSWSGPGNFTAKTADLDSLSDFGCYTITVTDTVTNCSIDSTICLEDKTATFDLELNNITVYPNPTKGDFIIDFAYLNSGEAQISIFDLSGKRKLEISKSNKERILRIDARDLYSGLYIIQIQFKGKKPIYKKIVIDY